MNIPKSIESEYYENGKLKNISIRQYSNYVHKKYDKHDLLCEYINKNK